MKMNRGKSEVLGKQPVAELFGSPEIQYGLMNLAVRSEEATNSGVCCCVSVWLPM
jgi:hypothetical protein